MVVTFLPATSLRPVWQERTALPSTWTVQDPHSPEPQPNLVPVNFRCSRTTQSSGVSASASTRSALPLIVNETAICVPSSWRMVWWIRVLKPDDRGAASHTDGPAARIFLVLIETAVARPKPPDRFLIWKHYKHVPARRGRRRAAIIWLCCMIWDDFGKPKD